MAPNPSPTGTTSLHLLERARAGDDAALAELVERYLPRLRRWATGRLPAASRALVDTDDIVQDTVIRTLRRIDQFEIRGEGALQAYLRQALRNRLTDEYRHTQRRDHELVELGSDMADTGPSPLEQAIGREALNRYEAALQRVSPVERELVILRLELCYSYAEIAELVGKPSAAASRMAVSRAVARLSLEMGRAD